MLFLLKEILMSWFKKLFSRAKKTAKELAIDARVALVVAADNIAVALEDADGNGLPDVAERVARYAAQMVSALELIYGNESGSGAVKLNSAMQEVMASSRKGLLAWNVAKPFVEAAVALLPRKRAEGTT